MCALNWRWLLRLRCFIVTPAMHNGSMYFTHRPYIWCAARQARSVIRWSGPANRWPAGDVTVVHGSCA